MQNQKNNIKNICVIGCGRVGLPLALMLEYKGLNICGIDINEKLRDDIHLKCMPFNEPGFDDLLSKSKIVLYSDYSGLDLQMVDTFIITVGTPLGENIESEYKQILQVINNLIINNLIRNKLIILRSTISPGTSQFLIKYIEKQTKLYHTRDFYLAYCPERIAEGKSFEELQTQPNIIGYYGKITKDLCNELFDHLSENNVFVTYEEAELIKLFSNIYRYINFSIPNYFMYIAKKFGVDYIELNKILKYDYPRNENLANPGFTAGTCVKGQRLLKIYHENGYNIEFISYENFYQKYVDKLNTQNIIIDSFNSKIDKSLIKKIINVTKRLYTGKMYIFKLSNGENFECTEDHLIPIKINNDIIIKKANEIINSNILLEFDQNIKEIKIEEILVKNENNIDVYNIELETLENEDDLYYADFESRLIHHNCLRKDWGFINENFPQSDIVLQAYKINEFMPKFYVDLIAHDINEKKVGILGYTMKNDVDDTRDSLIPKMIKYIEKEVPNRILINEPNLPLANNSSIMYNDKFNNYNFINDSINYVIRNSDIIFIAMNHKEYKELKNVEILFKGKIVIDCWGILNKKLVNYF
jgi:nucleotide sugar dehydrogenase